MADDNAIRKFASDLHADSWFPFRIAALPQDGLLPFPLIPRRMFTYALPDESEMTPLSAVHCITVHHSGFPEPFIAQNLKDTADYLEGIRQFHTGKRPSQRGWADIGYHFAVDRAGRVWQLRSMTYQGAHVKNHNAGNLGIVVLCNFDLQEPAQRQLTTLQQFLDWLGIIFALPKSSIFPHATLADATAATVCPGLTLNAALAAWKIGH